MIERSEKILIPRTDFHLEILEFFIEHGHILLEKIALENSTIEVVILKQMSIPHTLPFNVFLFFSFSSILEGKETSFLPNVLILGYYTESSYI